MLKEIQFLHQNISIPNSIDSLINSIRHPDCSFPLNGLIAFCGKQGSGKTLSAVLYLKKIKELYPDCLVISNIDLRFCDYIKYEGLSQLHDVKNGSSGVVIFLDEIQIEFNSLESKDASIPIFELVCQQRKQRKHIIGTTQVFSRLQKPFREQFKCAVLCEKYPLNIFRQEIYTAENVSYEDDIKTELSPKGVRFYIPALSDFDLYDTYTVVERIRKG